jgi:hypothetical protein
MKYSDRHGGPYDRGNADSYYGRPARPHYFKGGTYMSKEVPQSEMTKAEIKAYNAGYAENEAAGYKKYQD